MKVKILEKLFNEIWEFIPEYHRFMHIIYKILPPTEFNKNQSKAIMILHYKGEINMSCLGEFLDLQKGSLTTLVDQLEKSSMIKRFPHPDDRRKIILKLTKSAEKYIIRVQNEIQGVIKNLFNEYSENEILDLKKSFKNLSINLKKIME